MPYQRQRPSWLQALHGHVATINGLCPGPTRRKPFWGEAQHAKGASPIRIVYIVDVGLMALRGGVLLGLVFGLLASSSARADEYTNQIEMTATLLKAKPAEFDKACTRLLGKLVKGDGIAKCERGRSLLAISFTGDVVRWAMIAYPSTPEDIEGLWQKAQEVFGKPDVVEDKELKWKLKSGVTASAGYDDEYSVFSLVR